MKIIKITSEQLRQKITEGNDSTQFKSIICSHNDYDYIVDTTDDVNYSWLIPIVDGLERVEVEMETTTE